MRARLGIPLVIVGASLIVLAVAWGAATQHEIFSGQQESEQAEAAGSLVPLTAFLAGLGTALIVIAWGRVAPMKRAGWAALAGFSAWMFLLLVQIDFPNYQSVEGSGTAALGQNTLVTEGTGAPTVLLPVLALGLALFAGVWLPARRAVAGPFDPSTAARIRQFQGAAAVAIPILAIGVVGPLRLMFLTPGTTEGASLAYKLLPLTSVAALAWLVLILIRLWNVHAVLEDNRLVPVVREAWQIHGRIEWGIVGLTLILAVLSSALPATVTDGTGMGRTILLTLRSHGQGLAFIVIALLPLLDAQRKLDARLRNPDTNWGDVSVNVAPLPATIVASFSLVGAVIGVLLGYGLLPWILATAPVAIYAAIRLRANAALPIMFLAAWVMWARGNAFVAFYDVTQFPTMDFATHPGLSALMRIAGAGFAAWAIHRVMVQTSTGQRRPIAITLALVTGLGVALVGLLEAPLWIWDEGRVPVAKIAVGSLLRSQGFGVQVVSHIFAALAGLGAAMAATRIVRPDWHQRQTGVAAENSAAQASAP